MVKGFLITLGVAMLLHSGTPVVRSSTDVSGQEQEVAALKKGGWPGNRCTDKTAAGSDLASYAEGAPGSGFGNLGPRLTPSLRCERSRTTSVSLSSNATHLHSNGILCK
jgi:hypothetical protein